LLWAWAWEHGRTADEIVAAGWAGVLTFPRELAVVDGELASRPATELVALRRERLDWQSGVDLSVPAFEVESTGPVRLCLADAGTEVIVLDVAPDPAGPTRVLVDGSLVEAFSGPTPVTTRAYPLSSSTWVVHAEPANTTVWRLGQPSNPQ
jgi:beta-fructofuranosidase